MDSVKHFMQKAIDEAKKAGQDVPVGAVVVKDGVVIASAHNEREKQKDPSAHAEVLAVRKASSLLKNWRLDDCDVYVTLEPCPMCAWIIIQARVNAVYFGSYDKQYGSLGSVLDLRKEANSKLKVYGGILEQECDNIINDFWKSRR